MFEISQESLALALSSSTRHISRMENGRAHPSPEMVTRLAEHFGLGPRDTHQLLFAAGYATVAPPIEFDAPQLRWTRKGAAQALAAFEPHPAMVFDGSGEIRMANRGWLDMWAPLLPDQGPYSVTLHFDLLLRDVPPEHQPRGWADVRCGIVMSLKQEAVLSGEPALQGLVDDLVSRHGLPEDWPRRALRVEPLSTFVIPVMVDGALRTFTHLTVDVGPRGATTRLATPRLLLMALLPHESEVGPPDHPLHLGHYR